MFGSDHARCHCLWQQTPRPERRICGAAFHHLLADGRPSFDLYKSLLRSAFTPMPACLLHWSSLVHPRPWFQTKTPSLSLSYLGFMLVGFTRKQKRWNPPSNNYENGNVLLELSPQHRHKIRAEVQSPGNECSTSSTTANLLAEWYSSGKLFK